MRFLNPIVVLSICFIYLFPTSQITAQTEIEKENDIETSNPLQLIYGADIVSKYIWRGAEIDSESLFHIQPSITLEYDAKSAGYFSTYVWSSVGVNSNYFEINLAINYQIETKFGLFGLGVNDYYYAQTPFFNFKSNAEGSHTIETQLSYTVSESFPLQILYAKNILNDEIDDNSHYIEAMYSIDASDFLIDVFIGAAKGISYYYDVEDKGFQLINTGVNVIKNVTFFKNVEVPIGVNYIYNPYKNKNYLVLKLSYYI